MEEGFRFAVDGLMVDWPEKEIIRRFKDADAKDKASPYVLRINSDHALYIEFGTGPAKGPAKSGKGSGPTDTLDKIKEWVMARSKGTVSKYTGHDPFSKMSKSELDQVSYLIYRKIMNYGIPPQPFIRPAIHEMERRLESGEYDYEGCTMEDVLNDLVELMRRNLDENHTIYDGGSIADSIEIEKVDFDDPILSADPLAEMGISEEIWQSDYMDKNGNTRRAYERKMGGSMLRWQ